jgi:DNA primase
MLLERLSSKMVLALDADRAGIAAVKRSSELMLSRGMDVKVAHMPDGKDPADIIKGDPKEFKKIIGAAKHVIEFLLLVLKQHAKDDRTYKLHAREEILPLVLTIPNKIDREYFEGVVASAIGATKEAIHYELERLASERSIEPKRDVDVIKEETGGRAMRRDSLIEHLYALSLVLRDSEKSIAKQIEKYLRDLVPRSEFEALAALSSPELSKRIFTAEKYIEGLTEHQLQSEISNDLTEISHRIARERLRAIRKKMAETGSIDEDEDTQEEETKQAESLLQQTIQIEV